MNILLTGANGFTGLRFAALARQAGHEVTALQVDLTEPLAVTNAVASAVAALPQAQPWAVVHLAALSFVGHADELAFYGVNVLGTLNLLAALAGQAERPSCVLVASSANVYGNCPQSPIAESQTPAPVNHYAASKVAMEHLARAYADRLPLVLTRPFNYTGPGQAPQFLIPKLVEHFARRAPVVELGNLHVEREYNDVDFVCRSYLHLLAHGEPLGLYNICTGITYTLDDLIARLRRLAGHAIEVCVNPAFVRPNEIQRLCGDPARLQAVWRTAGDEWPTQTSLDATLARMLAAAAA
ncbi:nucleoside-diphosphate-sugar epimerase [Acidovorax sp. 62]|uniref:GDP-mannose 4,6-dehydratase n=1 Tax=Acidovorax sp. 62 TaxID=2035203 RepID=UPI000C18AC67|nr:GDP-mannose 4,6-dehydratase [Acidovorax sp. 62]PIF93510.1 nucleoside-diphosphate-sugar epimerase [Acidovorax sp. 62]